MRTLTVACFLCVSVPACSQVSATLGQSAVSAVLKQYSLNPLVLVSSTKQPLPTNGKWSIKTSRPDTCPHDDTPCARVIYAVPEAQVRCEWTVVPQHGSSPASFLDQNEDASHYLLRRLQSGDLAPLVITSPQPIYPPIARAAKVSGSVVVRVVVSGEGTVTSTSIVSGPEMLRATTVDVARSWTFHPLIVGTHSAPFVADLTAKFRVENGTVAMRP